MRRFLVLFMLLLLPVAAVAQVPPGKATGLPLVPHKAQLPSALNDPALLGRMLQGSPASYDLSALSGGIYDQGGWPRCSSFSMAAIKSYLDREEHGAWYWFDAVLLFHEGGGSDTMGGANEWMESAAINLGCLRTQTGNRYHDQSFAQVPSVPGVFEETIKAAVSSGKPVHLAVLLPYQFAWDSNENVNPYAYHALAIVGYTADGWVIVQNSWGPDWGNRGFGRLRWSFLLANNFQGGYCYALVPTDATDSFDAPAPPPSPAPAPAPPPAPGDPVSELLALINQARSANGLGALSLYAPLMASAQGYAQVLASGAPFSHTGPDGSTPFSRMHAAGDNEPIQGENIASGFPNAASVFAAWKGSPGHWANILYPQYQHIGIGIAGTAWVNDFSGSNNPSPSPTPRPVPPPSPTPTPTPTPVPTPTPTPRPSPSGLTVALSASLTLRGALVTATASGGSGPVSLTLVSGSLLYPAVGAQLGSPYTWHLVQGGAGTAITVIARTSDGRTAQASALLHW